MITKTQFPHLFKCKWAAAYMTLMNKLLLFIHSLGRSLFWCHYFLGCLHVEACIARKLNIGMKIWSFFPKTHSSLGGINSLMMVNSLMLNSASLSLKIWNGNVANYSSNFAEMSNFSSSVRAWRPCEFFAML